MFGNLSSSNSLPRTGDGLPFPGRSSLPTSFVSFLVFYIFSYLFLKTMVCFSGCLISSASLQKLFCGVCSALKCSFEEFVREKVVFPSYSSAIFPSLLVSDSLQPQRWQPTRVPRPWDSPGNNTGVGYHFLLQCMNVKIEREVAQSCSTLSMDCRLPGSSIHRIFQARVLEWGAIAFSESPIVP